MKELSEMGECLIENRGIMESFISISMRDGIQADPQVAWINRNQLILSINN